MSFDPDLSLPGNARQLVRDAVRNHHRASRHLSGRKVNDLTKAELLSVASCLEIDVPAIIAAAANESAKADFQDAPPPLPPMDRDLPFDAAQTRRNDEREAAERREISRRAAAAERARDTAPPVPSDMQGAAQAMAALMAALQPQAPSLDLDTVRKIIADEIERAGRPRPVDISINSVPKGQLPAMRHHMAEVLLQIIAQNVPAYLVGPAGSGKTTAAEQSAAALDLPFYMTGAVSGAHEYLGFMDAHGKYHTTPFREAFEKGGVFLADEIDGSDPAAPLVLNAALANGVMPFPDVAAPVARHPDFRMVAAANTYGQGADRLYVGRNQMDASTLDRFAFISWTYDEPLERQLSGNEAWARRVQAVRGRVAKLSMRHVVSPRASIYGAKLLAAGMSQDAVETLLLWKGLKAEDVARLKGGA